MIDLEQLQQTLQSEPDPRSQRQDPSGQVTTGAPSLSLFQQQRVFGYTADEIKMVLGPMVEAGAEPAGSLGHDTPLAVLSRRPQLLFSYFRQFFALVANLAIAPMSEH